MKQSVGMKIGGGFGVALGFLLVIGAVSYRSTAGLIENAARRSQAYQGIAHLQNFLGLIRDAESGQRGYLLAGEERYLDPYRTAVQQVDKENATIRQVMADSPNQLHRLDGLEPLLKDKLSEFDEAITLRREKGLEAALVLVHNDRGKKITDDIRKILDDMVQEEHRLLEERNSRVESSARNATAVILYGIPVAFIILGIVAVLLTRNISRPLKEVTGFAERLARGDLTLSLTVNHRRDEIGALRQAFGRLADNLRAQIGEITEGTAVLLAAVSEVAATTSQLAASTTESAAAVTQTSATAREVKQTAQVTSQKAQYVSDNA
ncbi:MAG: methyl-accepting chemotaxis protein, partial [Deltaproteobacteria bacterium]|nr:methyl-accepting chemotaxis protein [Deltaproteobacteria bacterium]